MKKTNLTIIAAVFTAVLSTLCCLPAFLFLFFGISSGLLSYFTTLEYTRIPLAIVSILLFIYALYKMRKKISCECDNKSRNKSVIIVIILFITMISLLFYPEFLPYFMD